jgi:hypothetical protein
MLEAQICHSFQIGLCMGRKLFKYQIQVCGIMCTNFNLRKSDHLHVKIKEEAKINLKNEEMMEQSV